MATSVFWKDTAKDLAQAILSLAYDADMPASFWQTDTRINLACSILGLSPDEAYCYDWKAIWNGEEYL